VLYTYRDNDPNGAVPYGDLLMDKAGNIYGTVSLGGQGISGIGISGGTVFELSRGANGVWTYTTLHSFVANTGGGFGVSAGLVMDSAGNLYGTTIVGTGEGVTGDDGVVFKLTRGANGRWTETVLHTFHNPNLTDTWGRKLWAADGYGVKSPLLIDAAGNLYGTTYQGGDCSVSGCAGIAYKLAPGSNGTWTYTILHTFNGFATHSKDGNGPMGRLVIDAAGNLYGTTQSGGPGTGGVVFKLAPGANGAWTETVLHSFPLFGAGGGKEGFTPLAGLIFDSAGNLYGTASSGGPTSHFGVVFEILAGSGPAVSTDVQPAAPSAPSNPANPTASSPVAPQGTDALASTWQSDAFAGQTFRFRLNGNAIDVYGGQQELLGTLQAKEKKGAIEMYQGLVQIAPLTQCPGGRGLMQIQSWNESRLDAKIETPLRGPSGITCGGVMGTGRFVRWQQVTFVKN
jgi:uncharacterized repeat protein (TIGR03803 family)